MRCVTRRGTLDAGLDSFSRRRFAYFARPQIALKDFNVELGPTDSFLSFLPLAHIFDRVIEEAFLYSGGRIGYWQVRVLIEIGLCSS
jgi:hypothetical protein